MDRVDQALQAYFRETEAPNQDEGFVWRVIEEYERRTRYKALAWKAGEAACASAAALVVLHSIVNLSPATQITLSEAFRGAVLLATLGTAVSYAWRILSGSDPMTQPARC